MTLASLIVITCLGALVVCAASESRGSGHLRGGDDVDMAGAYVYDCSAGCPVGSVDLVCADGITFQHECFASCQGMSSIERGPCNDDAVNAGLLPGPVTPEEASIVSKALSVGDSGNARNKVTINQINRYAMDEFVFIGHVTVDENDRPHQLVYNPPLDGDGFPIVTTQEREEDLSAPVAALRLTYDDGLVFVSKKDYPRGGGKKAAKGKTGKEGKSIQEEAAVVIDGVDDVDQHLIEESIIGPDTRSPVENTRKSPYNKIVELDYGGGEGGCTGLVVGRDTVLTAAHCVYNRGKNRWHPLKKVAPGRYRSGGESKEPYGTWEAESATIYGEWVNGGKITHDVAMVKIKTNSRTGSIGTRVGTVPLVSLNCNVPASSHVTGYPADKPNGEMNTSGRCDAWRHNCGDLRVSHQCDTKGGNSGAPLLDDRDRVFGVHTHGGGQWNSGVIFTDVHMKVIKTWIR